MVSQKQLNTFHLFAGAGGGILADLLLGHNPIGACEIEPYPRNVLLARQADGILPNFPIWDDVGTLDGTLWRGSVDVLCGGFPCQDISSARTNNHVNGKQLGLDGAKSGLWRHMARVIMEMRPEFALIENSPNLRTKGLVTVLQDLDAMGYHTRRLVLGSGHLRADHWRKRMWILAYSDMPQCKGGGISSGVQKKDPYFIGSDWRESESRLERSKDGMAHRLDRLKAIGNGQDCRVAATAFSILSEGLI
jgi:DNA (cytosine-5)-methyltransferase 1